MCKRYLKCVLALLIIGFLIVIIGVPAKKLTVSLLEVGNVKAEKMLLPLNVPFSLPTKNDSNYFICENYGTQQATVTINVTRRDGKSISETLIIQPGAGVESKITLLKQFISTFGRIGYGSSYKGVVTFNSTSKNVECMLKMLHINSNYQPDEVILTANDVSASNSFFYLNSAPTGNNNKLFISNLSPKAATFSVRGYTSQGSQIEKRTVSLKSYDQTYISLTTELNTVVVETKTEKIEFASFILSEGTEKNVYIKASQPWSVTTAIPADSTLSIANTSEAPQSYSYKTYSRDKYNSDYRVASENGEEISSHAETLLEVDDESSKVIRLKTFQSVCNPDGVCIPSNRQKNLIGNYRLGGESVPLVDLKTVTGTVLIGRYDTTAADDATITITDGLRSYEKCGNVAESCYGNNVEVYVAKDGDLLYGGSYQISSEDGEKNRITLNLTKDLQIPLNSTGQILLVGESASGCNCFDDDKEARKAFDAYISYKKSELDYDVAHDYLRVLENTDSLVFDGDDSGSLLSYIHSNEKMPFLPTTLLWDARNENQENVIKCINYGTTAAEVEAEIFTKYTNRVPLLKLLPVKIKIPAGEVRSYASIFELFTQFSTLFPFSKKYGYIEFRSSDQNVECKIKTQVVEEENVLEEVEFTSSDVQTRNSYLISTPLFNEGNPVREELVIFNLTNEPTEFTISKYNTVGNYSDGLKKKTYTVSSKARLAIVKRDSTISRVHSTYHVVPNSKEGVKYIVYLRHEIEYPGGTKVVYTKPSETWHDTPIFSTNGVLVVSNISSAPMMFNYDVYDPDNFLLEDVHPVKFQGSEWLLPYAQRTIDLKKLVANDNYVIKLQPWNVFYPTNCNSDGKCIPVTRRDMLVANFYPDDGNAAENINDKRTYGGTLLVADYDGSKGEDIELVVSGSERDFIKCFMDAACQLKLKKDIFSSLRIVVKNSDGIVFDKLFKVGHKQFLRLNLREDLKIDHGSSGQILVFSETYKKPDNTCCYNAGDEITLDTHAYLNITQPSGYKRRVLFNVVQNLDPELSSEFVRYRDNFTAEDLFVLRMPQELPVSCYEYENVIDSDGDGLCDIEESKLGLSKSSPDQDKDGVRDGEEVYHYFSSPKKKDTDGDGFSDKKEIDVRVRAYDKNITPNKIFGDSYEMFKKNPNGGGGYENDYDCSQSLAQAYSNGGVELGETPVWFSKKIGSWYYPSITPLLPSSWGDYEFYDTFSLARNPRNMDAHDIENFLRNKKNIVYFRITDLRRSSFAKENISKEKIAELVKLYIEAYLSIVGRVIERTPCIAQDVSDEFETSSDIQIYLVDTISKVDKALIEKYEINENRRFYSNSYDHGKVVSIGAGLYQPAEIERSIAHQLGHFFGLADLHLYARKYQFERDCVFPRCPFSSEFPQSIMAYNSLKINVVDVLNIVMRAANYNQNLEESLSHVKQLLDEEIKSSSSEKCINKGTFKYNLGEEYRVMRNGQGEDYAVINDKGTDNYKDLAAECSEVRYTIVDGKKIDNSEYDGKHKYISAGYEPDSSNSWWGKVCCAINFLCNPDEDYVDGKCCPKGATSVCNGECCGGVCLRDETGEACCEEGDDILNGQCCGGKVVKSSSGKKACCGDKNTQVGEFSVCNTGECCNGICVKHYQSNVEGCCPNDGTKYFSICNGACCDKQCIVDAYDNERCCANPKTDHHGLVYCCSSLQDFSIDTEGSGHCCPKGSKWWAGGCCANPQGTTDNQLCCEAGAVACGGECCDSGNCINGVCCPEGASLCGGACCAAGNQCVDGQCLPSCSSGEKNCPVACCSTKQCLLGKTCCPTSQIPWGSQCCKSSAAVTLENGSKSCCGGKTPYKAKHPGSSWGGCCKNSTMTWCDGGCCPSGQCVPNSAGEEKCCPTGTKPCGGICCGGTCLSKANGKKVCLAPTTSPVPKETNTPKNTSSPSGTSSPRGTSSPKDTNSPSEYDPTPEEQECCPSGYSLIRNCYDYSVCKMAEGSRYSTNVTCCLNSNEGKCTEIRTPLSNGADAWRECTDNDDDQEKCGDGRKKCNGTCCLDAEECKNGVCVCKTEQRVKTQSGKEVCCGVSPYQNQPYKKEGHGIGGCCEKSDMTWCEGQCCEAGHCLVNSMGEETCCSGGEKPCGALCCKKCAGEGALAICCGDNETVCGNICCSGNCVAGVCLVSPSPVATSTGMPTHSPTSTRTPIPRGTSTVVPSWSSSPSSGTSPSYS